MKFSIQREGLISPLQLTSGIIEKKQTLPILSNLKLSVSEDGLICSGTDLEIEIKNRVRVNHQESGSVTVPARKFFDIVRSLPDESEILVETREGRMEIRSGVSRFILSCLPANDFPELEEFTAQYEVTLPQDLLKKIIARTSIAMGIQDVRYFLNGVLFEFSGRKLRAVATDGHRLALSEMPVPETSRPEIHQDIIVPRKAILELLKFLGDTEEDVLVQVDKNHIRFRKAETMMTTKLIDGNYPVYQRVIPEQSKYKVQCVTSDLKQAISRVSILSSEKSHAVRLRFDNNSMMIKSNNAEQEEAQEQLPISFQGLGFETSFNANYLKDTLSQIQTEFVDIHITDSNSCCLIKDETNPDSIYIIMPMQI